MLYMTFAPLVLENLVNLVTLNPQRFVSCAIFSFLSFQQLSFSVTELIHKKS